MGKDDGPSLVQRAITATEVEGRWLGQPELRKLPEVQAILEADDDTRRACVLELSAAIAATARGYYGWNVCTLLALAAARKLPLRFDDVRTLLEHVRAAGADQGEPYQASEILNAVIKRIESAAAEWSPEEVAELALPIDAATAAIEDQVLAARLWALVSEGEPAFERITDTDDVGPRVRAVLERSTEDRDALAQLVEVATSLPASGKPSKKWFGAADAALAKLRDPARLLSDLLDALLEAADVELTHTHHDETYTTTHFFHYQGANENLALAFTRLAAALEDPGLLPRLRRLALKSVTVIGGEYGNPRSLKLANAAAQAIADVAAPNSITELLSLERAVRHGTLLKAIRKAIDALAEAQGITRDELLERAVETHDLAPDGTRDVPLSRGSARVAVDARSAALGYVDEDGTPRKSFPAAVKEADGETLAALREELKGIRKTIAGERHRLDGLLATDRRWSLDDWRALYLDHPVTGRMARELIWGFGDLLGIPLDATTVRTADGATTEIPAGADVRLWHPIHSPPEEVRAWRQHLLDAQVAQPVKQAFRETYALTPAEAETGTYSNRFAAHVFRQVQARALMKRRGWSGPPLAWWDDGIDHGVAGRIFEPFGVQAEFFYDPILDEEPQGGDLYPFCTSDQVRFFDRDGVTTLDLADVPLLVFTEAMRDVDLFIGVTSIGNDPQWLDRGEGRRFENYWNAYSFGDIGASAEVRREVLAQLLPRLVIADRCELEERFLAVRGQLRTYRIHLGSGNILMSPDDRYLCIVAARDGRAVNLFLPFDDDPVLSLILSKAFMLAEDAKITDATITAQIERA